MLMYYKNSRKIVHALRCLWSDKKKIIYKHMFVSEEWQDE